MIRRRFLAAVSLPLLVASSAHAATVNVINADLGSGGFNDNSTPTLSAPGNSGATVGEQKLEVVQWAAAKLGTLLYSPVTVVIAVSHDDELFCDTNAATLASAGPTWLVKSDENLVADHPNMPTWFPSALSNRLTGNQAYPVDVSVSINPDLGDSDCLSGFEWYYGLDNNPPSGALPFVDTVLHEMTHGLGFTSLTDNTSVTLGESTGEISPYFAYAFDNATNKYWWQMTDAERATSSTNGLLVWAGPATTRAAALLGASPLDSEGRIFMYAPSVYDKGSSLSHFEESTSPDLLMEPFASSDLDVLEDDIDLAREFLYDMGWRDPGCGNGIVDDGEECDLGDGNDAAADEPGECTTSCEWFVVDNCPSDPAKTSPGLCGCGIPDINTDGDNAPDCLDACPNDANKIAEGACGCGNADTDTDADGTADCVDGCPQDGAKIDPGICGCGTADTDTDADGTPDCNDGCDDDPAKVAPGVCGCGNADTDTDADGTADCLDDCDQDPQKQLVGLCGCGVADTDSDSDGTPDCNDACATDQNKLTPGLCGCGVADSNSDGDPVPDCQDACPNDGNKIAPGLCGCGASDGDADSDGTPDCNDQCPQDAMKTDPGTCGCSVADVDRDGDGSMDCNDGCPEDPKKLAPGICGCAVSDVDADGDGTADCHDACPQDGRKTSPGECGCGIEDVDSDRDGTLDCKDGCPTDNTKTAAGACGCGIPDTDYDQDRVADCMDECPTDARKLEPGHCGCGEVDLDIDHDQVWDCDDACPTEPGLASRQGCPSALDVLGDGGVESDVGDAGAAKSVSELEKELRALADAGTIDEQLVDELLADGGLTKEQIRNRVLERLLGDFAQDGGAKIDLGLELPEPCQCRLPGRRGSTAPRTTSILALMALGLTWLVRRRS